MSKKNDMFDHGFDPYDALIELNERLNRLELAHNQMAHAYMKTEKDLSVCLHSLRNLQQHHLKLSQKLAKFEEDSNNKIQ